MPQSGGPKSTDTPNRPRGLIAAALTAVFMLSGCTATSSTPGSSRSAAAPSTRTPSVTTGSGSTTAGERAAVERAYRAFWPLLVTIDRRYPPAQWRTVLGRVAADPQLSQAIAVARQQRRIGVRLYGQPHPRAPEVTLSRGKASVFDCADFSQYGQTDATTGQPRTVGVARNPVKATLIKGEDGVWRVAQVSYPRGGC